MNLASFLYNMHLIIDYVIWNDSMTREVVFIMAEKSYICDTELEDGAKIAEVKSKYVASKSEMMVKRNILKNKKLLRIHEKKTVK